MPRHHYDRHALRCAYQIQATLQLTRQAILQDHARWVVPIVEQLPRIARYAALLTRAAARSPDSAATRLVDQRLHHQLQTTAREIQGLNGQLACESCQPIPSLRDLLGELDQLENEFGEWRYDGSVKELSVTTEPIYLEGINLGPFTIRLRLGQPMSHSMGQLCSVQALEPNSAASNQEVTHPHVSGETICVGDAGPELVRALRSGRVCDFFLMIRSILLTYNPDSPYVSLDEWHGEPCADCGVSINEDGRYTCETCDRIACDDCIFRCPHCEIDICYGCTTMCQACKESTCAECLSPCGECAALVCPDCIEEDLCPTCLENQHDQDDPEEINEEENPCEEDNSSDYQPSHPEPSPIATKPSTPAPAVHTQRLGEAGLPLPPR